MDQPLCKIYKCLILEVFLYWFYFIYFSLSTQNNHKDASTKYFELFSEDNDDAYFMIFFLWGLIIEGHVSKHSKKNLPSGKKREWYH